MITLTEISRLCPSPETVRKYLEGWTDEISSQQIEEHLGQCEACSNAFEQDRNPSDHWLQAIRSEKRRTTSEAVTSENKPDSELIDLVAQQAIERSKRMLLNLDTRAVPHSGKSIARSIGPSISASISALGEIGPYELIRPIGQGGMGYVMLARHKHLDKEVAVKILPSTPWRIPSEEARFQREVRAVGKLEHPSIVTALDAGEYQGTHFLAMEFVDGLDLSRLTKALGPLTIPDACELIRQTALGLSYAHAQGIVHRDVKPSNLMLDRSGRIKILDFGLAQLQPWDDGCADLTSVGQLMGTLDYMAPEQAEHGGAVSYRADLYSLGATLFRLLVGRAPLAITPTQTPIEKLRLLSNHPIPRLKTMLPDAPDGLCSIVDSLLSRDPSQRPPSASHLAELLEPWAMGAELVAILQSAQTVAAKSSDSQLTNPNLLASQRLANPTNGEPSSHPKTQTSRGRSHWNWILWTAASLLAPLAAFGGFLIYLETQKGQIVVESEVAAVRVRVVADGKEVDDIQLTQGANSIRLRAGKYELLIDSPTDSITMSNQVFVLKQGETIVARIRREEQSGVKKVVGGQDVAVSPPADNLPQYNGKSLQEWLAVLDRERSSASVSESLTAIDGLATRKDRELIRKPLNEQIQRFSNDRNISVLALQIEKKISDEVEFESRLSEILKKTHKEALSFLIAGSNERNFDVRSLLSNDRMFAEILMSFGIHSGLKTVVAKRLVDLLQKTDADFKPEELSRFCEQIFRSAEGNSGDVHYLLFNPTLNWPTEVSRAIDTLVLSVLRSRESLPDEVAHAMNYLLNAKSLARVQKDVVPAIEKILIAMSKDKPIRSTDTRWGQFSLSERSERAKEFDSMLTSLNGNIPYSIFILRFISAAGLTADLAQPLREFAKGCLASIQPVEPELLMLRINQINASVWEFRNLYSLKTKALGWKKDFFAFHASVRLLQSNKLADVRDFVPEGAAALDEQTWIKAAQTMSNSDKDLSGDLDKDEFGRSGDFAVADQDGDGSLTEVETYRYLIALEKQKPIAQSAREIQAFVTALNAYHAAQGAFPSSLRSLDTMPDDAPPNWVQYIKRTTGNDPWENPYKYTLDGQRFRIRSNGPDGLENTEDDITNLE